MSYATWRRRIVIAQRWRESLHSMSMVNIWTWERHNTLTTWVTWKRRQRPRLGGSWWWCKWTIWLLQCTLWWEHRAVLHRGCWRPRFRSRFLLDRNRSTTETCGRWPGRVRRRVVSGGRPAGGIRTVAVAWILGLFSFTPLCSAILKPHLSRQAVMIV